MPPDGELIVRPARIELATLGLGVPCSIQFELRARTLGAGVAHFSTALSEPWTPRRRSRRRFAELQIPCTEPPERSRHENSDMPCV